MSITDHEARILETIVPELEAQGYTVLLQPPAQRLPKFMKDYVPDAIALGSPKNLAIEIVSEASPYNTKLEELRERFREVTDWELRVYYVRPTDSRGNVEIVQKPTIESALTKVSKLVSDGQTQPALLMAWASLEAIGRALLPEKFIRPQTPGRLVEVLASNGYLTPGEADFLRDLAHRRNRLTHGSLGTDVDEADLIRFVSVLKTLLDLLPA